MSLTLAQIEIFTLIAKHKSVSLAANACFISQAAASMRLSQLETQLEQKLFDRDGKRLILNYSGKQLLAQANNIIQCVAGFEASAKSHNQVTGQLQLGASTTIANYILPNILSDFLNQYPGVDADLTALNTESCISKLLNFEIDIALVEGVFLHQKIEFKPWKQDQLQVFCHPDHPLTKKKILKPTDLCDYPWILREPASGTRQLFESALQHSSVTLNNIMVVNSSHAIKNIIIAKKDALGCLSNLVISNDVKSKKLTILNVKGLKLKRHFYQAIYSHKSRSPATKLFNKFIWGK
jgi:DNA-binding transcriptional LysR family regulator